MAIVGTSGIFNSLTTTDDKVIELISERMIDSTESLPVDTDDYTYSISKTDSLLALKADTSAVASGYASLSQNNTIYKESGNTQKILCLSGNDSTLEIGDSSDTSALNEGLKLLYDASENTVDLQYVNGGTPESLLLFDDDTDKITLGKTLTDLAVDGSLAVTGNVDLTGNVTVNTNKFTVAGATGNTVIAGTLTQTGAVAAAASITLGAGADLIGSATSDITINTNKFTVAGATGNTVIGGTTTLTGVTSASAGVAFGATENAAANGAWAIPITKGYQGFTTNATGALAATLADGAVGQRIWLVLTLKDTNNCVVTPANLNSGTTITFDTTGDYAELMFVGTGWEVLHATATVA